MASGVQSSEFTKVSEKLCMWNLLCFLKVLLLLDFYMKELVFVDTNQNILFFLIGKLTELSMICLSFISLGCFCLQLKRLSFSHLERADLVLVLASVEHIRKFLTRSSTLCGFG